MWILKHFRTYVNDLLVGGLSPGYHQWSPEEGFRLGNQVILNLNQDQKISKIYCGKVFGTL